MYFYSVDCYNYIETVVIFGVVRLVCVDLACGQSTAIHTPSPPPSLPQRVGREGVREDDDQHPVSRNLDLIS